MSGATERIATSSNPAEATARYWMWRAGNAGSPEEQELLRAKVLQTDAGVRDPVIYKDIAGDFFADRVVNNHGGSSHTAGRLLVYRALLSGLTTGLGAEGAERFGVHYQTDYAPVGRMAEVLDGIDSTGLPPRTHSYTYPGFAYVTEQGEPITVIHGDFSVARAYIVEGLGVAPSRVLPINPGE